jgi:peroxiredoxin
MRAGTIGTPAPSLELPAAGGERHSLAEFHGRPVLISFLGPAFCPFCRAHVIKMIQAQDDIAKADVGVILVAFSDPELLMSKMMRDLNVPFLLLVDRSRESYVRWGLFPFSWKALLRPGLYSGMFKVIFKRHALMAPTLEPIQMGGDFVVDRAGTLVFVNRMRSLHDRAHVQDMLAAVGTVST